MNYEILTVILIGLLGLAAIMFLSVVIGASLAYLVYRVETNLHNQTNAQESDDD
jgi:hypothetical protein